MNVSLHQSKKQKRDVHRRECPTNYGACNNSISSQPYIAYRDSTSYTGDFPPPAAETDLRRGDIGGGFEGMLPPSSPISKVAVKPPRTSTVPTHTAKGKRGDPRMHKAVALRMANPRLTLLDALVQGGFVFPSVGQPGGSDRTIRDEDGVLLYQRKNQLNRRLRLARNKQMEAPAEESTKVYNEEAVQSASVARSTRIEAYEKKSSTKTHEDTHSVNQEKMSSSVKLPDEFCPPAQVLSSLKNDQSECPNDENRVVTNSFHESFLNLPDDIEEDMLGKSYTGKSRYS